MNKIISGLLLACSLLHTSAVSGFAASTLSCRDPRTVLPVLLASGNPFSMEENDIHRSALDRRQVMASFLAILVAFPSTPATASGDASAFVGTYSDPINHPGGTRTITLLDYKVGDYQLAQVEGGGGVGEPKSYVLPAMVFGDRAIVIDFSPKGGPRDFTAVLDGNKGIKFLRDGNKWPKIS